MKKNPYICARSRVDVCMWFTEVTYLERYQAFQPQNADDFPYLGSLHPSKVDTDSEIHHCKLCQWGYARLRGRVSVNRDIQVKNCLFTKQLFFLLQCKRHKHRPGRPAMNTDWVSLDPITRDEILALGNHTHLGRNKQRNKQKHSGRTDCVKRFFNYHECTVCQVQCYAHYCIEHNLSLWIFSKGVTVAQTIEQVIC